MASSNNSRWPTLSLMLGILAIISGIYLIFQDDLVIGIGGTITGVFLLYIQRMGGARGKDGP